MHYLCAQVPQAVVAIGCGRSLRIGRVKGKLRKEVCVAHVRWKDTPVNLGKFRAFPMKDLCKLAEAINMADEAYCLRDMRHGKTIPDAWHSVFQVKQAEDGGEVASAKAEGMSKADIIARYGEGILEEVEDNDGNIDHVRLSQVMRALGDDKEDKTDEVSMQPKQLLD